jgi:hypothetical protein
METVVDNFVNELSAGMSKMTVEDYQNSHDNFLANLDKIEKIVNKAVVKTVEQFKEVMEYKELLSSLFCYTFNNKKPEFDRVSALEDVLGKKLYQFAFSFNKVSPEIRHIAKYLLWGRYFRSEDRQQILTDALNAGILRKKGDYYYVIGMHLAVGDNTFSVSRRTGQQYRCYVKSCAIQAFSMPCQSVRQKTLDSLDIPELEDFYSTVSISDGKHCAKISLSKKDKKYISDKYVYGY